MKSAKKKIIPGVILCAVAGLIIVYRMVFCVPLWRFLGAIHFDIGGYLRQYRIILSAQMRQRIFRQTKQKFAGVAGPTSRIFVTYDGKGASRCVLKAQAVNCAVLP